MEKRGALAAKNLITIIILIVSFAIILAFLIGLNLQSETQKEVCRNSVVLRGNVPLGETTVKLSCKTEYVCISMGGECEGITSDARKVVAKDKVGIFEAVTGLMQDCWWQMGEGKVNYLPSSVDGPYCSICSRVYFDEVAKEEIGTIKLTEFYSYLRGRATPDGESNLLYYFYRMNDINSVLQSIEWESDASEEEKKDVEGVIGGELDLSYSKGYMIFTSATMKAWGGWKVVGVVAGAATGATLGAVSVLTLGATTPAAIAAGIAVGTLVAGAGYGTATFVVEKDGVHYTPPTLMIWDESVLKGMKCEGYATTD